MANTPTVLFLNVVDVCKRETERRAAERFFEKHLFTVAVPLGLARRSCRRLSRSSQAVGTGLMFGGIFQRLRRLPQLLRLSSPLSCKFFSLLRYLSTASRRLSATSSWNDNFQAISREGTKPMKRCTMDHLSFSGFSISSLIFFGRLPDHLILFPSTAADRCRSSDSQIYSVSKR